MMLSPPPDRRLEGIVESAVIAMAVGGDAAAFAELMHRRQHSVRRFMRQLCRRADLADDLSQQVFMRMWRSLNQLGSLDRFNGWLKQVMLSVWIDETRRHGTAVQATTVLTEDLEPSSRPSLGLEHDLEWALAWLDPRMRLCVVLAYGEGHSHSEIATMLRIPLGTAKSLVTRGSEKLRSLLDDYAKG